MPTRHILKAPIIQSAYRGRESKKVGTRRKPMTVFYRSISQRAVLLFVVSMTFSSYILPQSETSRWIWRGNVKTASGKPVKNVLVSCPPSTTAGVMTKADGSFELPVSGNCETIFFWNERFKPFSEPTRGHTQEPFDVIIDPVANSQWKIPRCSEVKDSKYYIGVGTHLRVKLPDTITFRTESYGGLTYYQLRFETAPQKWDWMLLTSEAPSGLHKEILLDGRADQRTWDSHGTLGIERRFGNYRLVTEAYGNSYIESKPESSKGTEIFNAIIDTVCNEPVAERSYSTGRGMIRIRTFKSGSGNGWLPRSRLQLTPQTYGRAEPYEYEAYTDEKGRFSFKDLPPGVYRLKISSLHEKYQRTLTVRPGRVQTHTFKVSPVTMKDVEKLQRSLTPAGNCPNC